MKQAIPRRAPWPGPRPYNEDEWELFFGRKEEVNEVEDRVFSYRLTILTGPSGSGKTSLLQAGIVPRLRLRRYHQESPAAWPLIVMREWGEREAGSFEGLLRGQLERSIRRLSQWEGYEAARQDHARFSEIFRAMPGSDIDHILLRMAGVLKPRKDAQEEGLIIVLDQLEEVLRAGDDIAEDLLEFIRRLNHRKIHWLLSMRKEALGDIGSLERAYGKGLESRTVRLQPISRRSIGEAIRDASREENVTISSEVIEAIVDDLLKFPGTSDGWKEKDVLVDTSSSLLILQVVLHELFHHALELHQATDIRIDMETFNGYVKSIPRDRETVVEGALSRWIDRALQQNNMPQKLKHRSEDDEYLALIRRLATRIGPHLSSAGYKVVQEQVDLFRKAAGEDIWGLGLRDPDMRAQIDLVEATDGSMTINHEVLGFQGPEEDGAIAEYLSGCALEQGWSRAAVAEELGNAFATALEMLQRANIARPILSLRGLTEAPTKQPVKRWELLHDGMGRAFAEWAERRRNGWEDSAASIVACRGISPIGLTSSQPPDGELRYARWEGCLIAPTSGGFTVLKAVEFRHCKLRGSIFEDVIFDGCSFEDCDLSGTVFRRCVFAGTGTSSVFDACNAPSLALLDCWLVGQLFAKCRLSQLTIRDCTLIGEVEASYSVIILANFLGLNKLDTAAKLVIEEDCEFSYNSGDEAAFRSMLDIRCKCSNSGWE